MRPEFLGPFVNATLNVLATMASTEAVAGAPEPRGSQILSSDVTGLIGLIGETTQGSFSISFSEACILRIVSNMLGEEITDLEGDVGDAVGEITNMISGSARAELERHGESFRMALPNVIVRRGHTTAVIATVPSVVVRYTTDAGTFFTETCLT